MKAHLGWPIVIIGPIYNGAQEHPALITRVWDKDKDTVDGPVTINAQMFPDGGGEPQFQNQIHLHDSRASALKAGTSRRVAYWPSNNT